MTDTESSGSIRATDAPIRRSRSPAVTCPVRDGYHPFVASPGFDAYYLNTLAGSVRSMAATDDPRYAHLRASWPPPDPRVPMIDRPV